MVEQAKRIISKRAGRPAKAQEANVETRIIAAATELFASRGFAGTSMEQVAARCKAGKDTVYRRYPSKVALFESVVDHAHKRARRHLQDLPFSEGDTMARLGALMREMLHVNMEPDLIAFKRITFSEAVVFERSSPATSQPDPIMEQLIDAVVAAQDAGMITAGDASSIATHLIHCLVALPTAAAMLGQPDYDTRQQVDAHFDKTWQWLINGVKA